jgi:carbon-monoxide dehydrogenase medium subunit
MKPAPFAYRAARSAGEAAELLAEPGAVILAGGQSLLQDLAFRTRRPRLVVDINRAADLDHIRVDGDELVIGALTRHAALEARALGARLGDPLGRLLGLVATHVAHPPIRARGTFAGSVANADKAAEWCMLAVALDARVTLSSAAGGARVVPAGDFLTGHLATVRRPDELLTEVRLPLLGAGTGVGFAEHRRTAASFAMVAAVATVRLDGDGRVEAVRVGLANAADRPVRAAAAEAVLLGRRPAPALLAEAAAAAAARTEPFDDPHCGGEYRAHLAGELARRALERALAGAAT